MSGRITLILFLKRNGGFTKAMALVVLFAGFMIYPRSSMANKVPVDESCARMEKKMENDPVKQARIYFRRRGNKFIILSSMGFNTAFAPGISDRKDLEKIKPVIWKGGWRSFGLPDTVCPFRHSTPDDYARAYNTEMLRLYGIF